MRSTKRNENRRRTKQNNRTKVTNTKELLITVIWIEKCTRMKPKKKCREHFSRALYVSSSHHKSFHVQEIQILDGRVKKKAVTTHELPINNENKTHREMASVKMPESSLLPYGVHHWNNSASRVDVYLFQWKIVAIRIPAIFMQIFEETLNNFSYNFREKGINFSKEYSSSCEILPKFSAIYLEACHKVRLCLMPPEKVHISRAIKVVKHI